MEQLAAIITPILGLIAVVFGAKWFKILKKVKTVAHLIAEVDRSLEDNTITPEELKAIHSHWKRLLGGEKVKQ